MGSIFSLAPLGGTFKHKKRAVSSAPGNRQGGSRSNKLIEKGGSWMGDTTSEGGRGRSGDLPENTAR